MLSNKYDIRAVRVSDRAVLEILATADDEREAEWLLGTTS